MDDPKFDSTNKNQQDTSDEGLNKNFDDTPTETYVTPTGEPTTITPLPTPLSLQKPKSHAGRWFVRGFVVLIIAALAAFGYWQWTEAQSANNERASLQSELDTVKAANKNADKEVDTQDVVVDTKTDEELIETEVETFLSTLEGSKLKLLESEIEGDFALVKAGTTTAGTDGMTLVLEKANDSWVVIFSAGSGDFTTQARKDLTNQFGVPATLLD